MSMEVSLDVLWNGKTQFNESGSIGRNTCSVILLEMAGVRILVDMGFPKLDRERLLGALRQRSIAPTDISLILLTHLHPDHMGNPDLFPDATIVYNVRERAKGFLKRYRTHEVNGNFTVVTGEGIVDVGRGLVVAASPVRAIMSPGHTMGSMTVLVDREDGVWALAGDAVLNEEDFRKLEPAHIGMDRELAIASMKRIGAVADVIVPGHGDTFRV